MRTNLMICIIGLCATGTTIAADTATEFSTEELAVAKFWEDMGPTLRDEGVEAYAERYHEAFRHWDIEGAGGVGNKAGAVRYWSKFHDDGHRITCTYVKPITIDIAGDTAIARLVYEQTNTYADGHTTTGVWRMVDVFQRYGDTWQVLDSNMIDIAPEDDVDDDAYQFHCPFDEFVGSE